MQNQFRSCPSRAISSVKAFFATIPTLTAVVWLVAGNSTQAGTPLRERLKASPFKIAHETYINDNWEIFVMNPDGSEPVNLTDTPNPPPSKRDERLSPEGKWRSFPKVQHLLQYVQTGTF